MMTREISKVARCLLGITSLAAAVGVLGKLVVAAGRTTDPQFSSAAVRVVNELLYFTIVSNLLLAVTCAMLALGLAHDSPGFRSARLSGVVAIAMTGIVHRAMLAGTVELHGLEAFADVLVHVVTPVLGLVGWFAFGPRGAVAARLVAAACLLPVGYFAVVVARGAFIHWFPYPFIDLDQIGLAATVRNALAILAGFALVAAVLAAMEAARADRRPVPSDPLARKA